MTIAAYRHSSLQSAPPSQVLLLLYREACLQLTRAEEALRTSEPGWVHALAHAREILTELDCALDPDQAPELCASLHDLYGWGRRELTHAGRARDADQVARVRGVLGTLLEGWTEAIEGESR